MSGFDWNGNNRSDLGDEYIDYRIATDDDGGEHKPSKGGTGGCGWGLLLAILIIAIIWFL